MSKVKENSDHETLGPKYSTIATILGLALASLPRYRNMDCRQRRVRVLMVLVSGTFQLDVVIYKIYLHLALRPGPSQAGEQFV